MSQSLVASVAWALLALLLILGACEVFTNGIEWFGRKQDLSEGAVGSILAAVGTAMPETIVPVVAILLVGGEGGRDVGIGGILGAPFMLSTLAFFVTGLSVLLFARRRPSGLAMPVNARALRRDVGVFVLAFAAAAGASFVPLRWARISIAILLVLGYVLYARLHLKDDDEESAEAHELRALYFTSPGTNGPPRTRYAIVQILTALAAIFLGAHLFVAKLTAICAHLGASARLLALIIVPIATELPEKFNSVLWIRQGKDTLALGNITGAMVFQSCIPAAIGILFTKWQLNAHDLTSVAIALLSGAVLYVSLLRTGRLSPFVLLAGVVGCAVFLVLALS